MFDLAEKMCKNRGLRLNIQDADETTPYEERFARMEQIFGKCCDVMNEGNALDLNNAVSKDFHNGDKTQAVQYVANRLLRAQIRIENQANANNASLFQNVLDRENHIFRITCTNDGLDASTRFFIKQWLVSEGKTHTSLFRDNDAVFFVHIQCQAIE